MLDSVAVVVVASMDSFDFELADFAAAAVVAVAVAARFCEREW